MLSTAQVAKATTDATVTLLLDNPGQAVSTFNVVNESDQKGWLGIGLDVNSITWFYLPAGNPSGTPATPSSRTIRLSTPDKYKLYMQRSSSNLTGISADMY